MKTNRFKILFLMVYSIFFLQGIAQTPNGFNYQTIIRDAKGDLLKNHQITLRISILTDSVNGTVVYSERQEDSTNSFGLLNIVIGEGAKLNGSFGNIDWSNKINYIKIEVDINGGVNYIHMGTNRLLAVPYAKFADKSMISLKDNDTSATNEIQEIVYINDSLKLSKSNGVRLNRYVPDSNCILGIKITPPQGYEYSGNYIEIIYEC